MLAQPMADQRLLKRPAATPSAISMPKEARPPQTLTQPMEDRQLRKRPGAPASAISRLGGWQAQPRLLLRCWAAPQTRPQPRGAAMEVQQAQPRPLLRCWAAPQTRPQPRRVLQQTPIPSLQR